jgi:heme/copper-type cytochrome/quinol oxidase subunit 2
MGFSDFNTFFINNLNWFHNYLISYLLGIILFVILYFIFLISYKGFFKYEGVLYSSIETFLSLYPTLILLLQIVPSLYLIYRRTLLDRNPDLTVKIRGHQ